MRDGRGGGGGRISFFIGDPMITLSDREKKRFLGYVRLDEETGCAIWTGHLNPQGYGRFWFKGNLVRATHTLPSTWSELLYQVDTKSCIIAQAVTIRPAVIQATSPRERGRSMLLTGPGRVSSQEARPEICSVFFYRITDDTHRKLEYAGRFATSEHSTRRKRHLA